MVYILAWKRQRSWIVSSAWNWPGGPSRNFTPSAFGLTGKIWKSQRRRSPLLFADCVRRAALLRHAGRQTKVEWVFDSAFRFFPVEPDLELGWRLNFWDAAANKVLAFAGRSKLRDLVDVLYLDKQRLPLGALAWAAAGKDPGMTPEAIIQWARRNAIYRNEELEGLQLSSPITLPELKSRWMEASQSALDLIAQLPPSELGCLYLNTAGQPVCPDPSAPE